MRYFFITFFLGAAVLLKAQQDPVFSFSQQQMVAVNPAMVALDNNLFVQALVRNQWSEANQSPTTQLISAGIPVHQNMGIGLTLRNDEVFIEKNTTVGIDYSYLVKLKEGLGLQIGVKAIGSSFRINSSGLKVFDSNYDNSLGNFSNFSFNFGAGAVLNHDNFIIGLSMPRLLANDRLEERNGIGGMQNRSITYLFGQYKIETRSGFIIKPGVVGRFTQQAPSSFDLSTFVQYSGIEGGLTWRVSQAVSASAVYHLKSGISLGYAYEFPVGNQFNLGATHEFLVSYSLSAVRSRSRLLHLRYMDIQE